MAIVNHLLAEVIPRRRPLFLRDIKVLSDDRDRLEIELYSVQQHSGALAEDIKELKHRSRIEPPFLKFNQAQQQQT